jgi:hypothetical protein
LIKVVLKCFAVTDNKNREEKQNKKDADNKLGYKYFPVARAAFKKDGAHQVQNTDDRITNPKVEIVNMKLRFLVSSGKTYIHNGQNKKPQCKSKQHPIDNASQV